MSNQHLFRKRMPLSRKLFILLGPLVLLFIFWPSTKKTEIIVDSFGTQPIEPPGAILLTPTASSRTAAEAAFVQPSEVKTAQETPDASISPNASSVGAVTPVIGDDKPEISSEESLRSALEQWRSAWEMQNLPTYLDSYAANFEPAQKISRQAWVNLRTARISSKQKISLTLDDLKVEVSGTMAVVTFTQRYVDERLRLTDQKTMVWQQKGDLWQIQRETTD